LSCLRQEWDAKVDFLGKVRRFLPPFIFRPPYIFTPRRLHFNLPPPSVAFSPPARSTFFHVSNPDPTLLDFLSPRLGSSLPSRLSIVNPPSLTGTPARHRLSREGFHFSLLGVFWLVEDASSSPRSPDLALNTVSV